MSISKFARLIAAPFVACLLVLPFAGCGVETEPLGVESNDDPAALEEPEYVAGEKEMMRGN
ncbi:hypothetical protein FF011L_16220 [Roseimaritima multifibrata]|uniref:Secreted protein n=1 Tax=Roseimaritima multifibrata TaxID=1930274 RepID=A0A517MDA8_9BACT|nr:hypothetical protein [Roseimaritima multifibrata]QDS92868.1 hypothetical protein FF011L_16220 [Roseimaritima multifibrata]